MSDGFTRRGVLHSLIVAPVALTLRDEFGVKPALASSVAKEDELLRIVLLNLSEEEICRPQFVPNGPGDVMFKQDARSVDLIHYWAVDLHPATQSFLSTRYYKQKIRTGHRLCDGDLNLHFDDNIIEYHM